MARRLSNSIAGRLALWFTSLAAIALPSGPSLARPLEKVTYLLPAPKEAIVLAPFLLAEREGRFRRKKLDVRFVVVPGGFNVGKALARGEGDAGGAGGDTPILLNAADLPIRGIALLGEHSFLTLVTRHDRIGGIDDLDGKAIDVPSLADTSYYAVRELAAGLPPGGPGIHTRARSSADLTAALARGEIDGFVGTVDWGVKAERAGVRLDYRSLDGTYPAMAQAIMASEASIRSRPGVLRAFVWAVLDSLAWIAKDPENAALAYAKAVPDNGYSHAEIVRIFRLMAEHVYGRAGRVGYFDRAKVADAQRELLERNLIAMPRDPAEYYTNAFVHP